MRYEGDEMVVQDRSLKLLDRWVGSGRTAFTAAEVRHELALSASATSNLLSRLAAAGLVDRVASGRYAIRPIGALGTAAVWDDLGSAVAAVWAGRPHRIGYLTALGHHGLLLHPVRSVFVAGIHRPHVRAVSGRPLHVVHELEATLATASEPLGPSRVSTVERALLETASRPKLSGGISLLVEALAVAGSAASLADLASSLGCVAGYRRIGSLATSLGLPVATDQPVPSWRSPIELDPTADRREGWIDKVWGVAWPFPVVELESLVAAPGSEAETRGESRLSSALSI